MSGATRGLAVVGGFAILLVASGHLWGCSDDPPPQYNLNPPLLRLVPDVNTVSPAGGFVFVTVEFDPEALDGGLSDGGSDAGHPFVTIFSRSYGAKEDSIPGPSFCQPALVTDAGGSAPPDGGLSDAGAGPDGGLLPGPADLGFPDQALRSDSARNARDTSLILTVAPGTGDVAVVAAAYAAEGPQDCRLNGGQLLLATAFLRISRTATDAGSPVVDAGAAVDAGAGSADSGVDGGSNADAGVMGGTDSGMPANDGGGDAGSQQSDAGVSDGGATADGGDGG